jgi:hypothetical protein
MSAVTTEPRGDAAVDAAEGTGTWGLMAEFDSPAALMSAAERTRDAGYRWWDCHTPFPVHGLDGAMGIKPTILPIVVFFAGLTGAMLGLILQWFTNATDLSFWAVVEVTGYPFLISGKPDFSLPANIPVIFETTILFSALTAFGTMFLFNGLPMLYHPTLKSERFRRVTDDRFFLVIEARDPKFYRAKTEGFLATLDPISIETLEA